LEKLAHVAPVEGGLERRVPDNSKNKKNLLTIFSLLIFSLPEAKSKKL
jgi:hypothetical protein